MKLIVIKTLQLVTEWDELEPPADASRCVVLFTSAPGPRYETPFAAAVPDEGKLYLFKNQRAWSGFRHPLRGIACTVDLGAQRLEKNVEVPLYGNRILRGVYDACTDFAHLARCGRDYAESQALLIRFLFQYLLDSQQLRLTSNPFFNSVSDYIERRLEEGPTVNDLVGMCNMNRTAFTRKFAQYFGESPQQYILKRRMEYAKRMLDDGATIKEVALSLGYNDSKAFSRAFKRVYDVSPGQMR